MSTNKLGSEAYHRTFQAPMQDVTATAEQVVDIWPYVDAIPLHDLDGAVLADVAYIYRSSNKYFEHVLIATEDKDVFLVVVIALNESKIHGHYLLDLAELYNLPTSST